MYEEHIFEKLKREIPGARVTSDVKRKGRFSEVLRQIDILVQGAMGKYPILGVVECKYFATKIDVKIVESFIGFLDDIGANLGIIITNVGFTPAAERRAKAKDIQLDIVEYSHLEDFHLRIDLCDCGNEINWSDELAGRIGKRRAVVEEGYCSYCDTLHIKCDCGELHEIYEGMLGESFSCSCGSNYVAERHYDGDAVAYHEIYLVERGKRCLLSTTFKVRFRRISPDI